MRYDNFYALNHLQLSLLIIADPLLPPKTEQKLHISVRASTFSFGKEFILSRPTSWNKRICYITSFWDVID